MKVAMILPALTEARSPFWRPIKYSHYPPLGLATLAAYLGDEDEVAIYDEHVEAVPLDASPDLVVIQVYVTSAYRSYELADRYRARGAHVALGGLHVTSVPCEAALHADSIFLGPGEDTWPAFLTDFRRGHPGRVYRSRRRSLRDAPPPRRDLIKRNLYLVPNSLVVSRGCPHTCDFCYKEAFFRGGASHYTQPVEAALQDIERLPGRHLFFLDDHLVGDCHFARRLFEGMLGMGRVFQGAATVDSVMRPGVLELAADAGLRSLFVGFETLAPSNLRAHGKRGNLRHDYGAAVRRMHDFGIMVNASFVFGMDHDDESAFDRTVEWAVEHGIETATFHILTPYPGTALHRRMAEEGRLTTSDWDLYDTRHCVFRPAQMTAGTLEEGYRRAYRAFYSWGSILRSASTQAGTARALRHLAYVGGWKKAEWFWDLVIRLKRVNSFAPILEAVLEGCCRRPSALAARQPPAPLARPAPRPPQLDRTGANSLV